MDIKISTVYIHTLSGAQLPEKMTMTVNKSGCKVCVTGGAGYIGSWLIRKLLQRGYIVHATLRNLSDESKVGLLRSFPGAETRLVLFEADIYDPSEFERAICGCEFVFHVATPMQHTHGFEYKSTSEAAVAGARIIKTCCARSATVRKLVYTASVMAASPLKEDGSGYKHSMDETCWTPLNVSFQYADDYSLEYTRSKTLAEKQILSESDVGDLEVVSLACGLVGGDTLLPYVSISLATVTAQVSVTNQDMLYKALKFVEELDAKVPIVHIDDVCEAHIFCIHNPSIRNGRFLCASSFVSSADMAHYYRQNYPDLHVKSDLCFEETKRQVRWGSRKLVDKGFEYKYEWKTVLDESLKTVKMLSDCY